jgi:hypothetical protein
MRSRSGEVNRRRRSVCRALLFTCALSVTLDGDGPKRASAEAVRPLVRMFNMRGQRAVSTADPREPGVFVAAVYTGTDLFLIHAHHPDGDELSRRIHSGQHQTVFFALRATPTSSGKFYIYDAGANGVEPVARQGESADEVREDDVRVVRFSGDLSSQRLTSVEYAEKLDQIDARYADLLKVLFLHAG